MMQTNKYEAPKAELVFFFEDVICNSGIETVDDPYAEHDSLWADRY